MKKIAVFCGFLTLLAAEPAVACYSWQIYTCSEGRPESTLDNLRREKAENRAITARVTQRVRVREVEQHLAEDTRVFVLDIEGAPYRHWLWRQDEK